MPEPDELDRRWNEAITRAAAKAISEMRNRGVTDATAGLFADLERELDGANAERDRIEWETGEAASDEATLRKSR